MCLANYKSPTVNIRAPKWPDNKFWIRAKNYEAAKYIADAVYYHIGRGPFHFHVTFHYPPLCLSNRDLLTTKEMCAAHVGRIAKVPALSRERKDYKERVKKLVLKSVNSPEAVTFLRSLSAIPLSLPNFGGKLAPDGKLSLDGNEAAISEEERHSAVTEDGEQGTSMEVDAQSEEAILSLSPVVCVDPANFFHLSQTNLFGDIDISTAFVPSFGMNLDENILHSEGQSIIFGYRLSKEYTIPGNLEGLLNSLDEGEQHRAFTVV